MGILSLFYDSMYFFFFYNQQESNMAGKSRIKMEVYKWKNHKNKWTYLEHI